MLLTLLSALCATLIVVSGSFGVPGRFGVDSSVSAVHSAIVAGRQTERAETAVVKLPDDTGVSWLQFLFNGLPPCGADNLRVEEPVRPARDWRHSCATAREATWRAVSARGPPPLAVA